MTNNKVIASEAQVAFSECEDLGYDGIEAIKALPELLDAMWQLLDDMGDEGQCVCLAAKEDAVLVFNRVYNKEVSKRRRHNSLLVEVRDTLKNIRAYMIPGMNWTDETGLLLIYMADDCIAKLTTATEDSQ